ncbi:hypothetical protein [Hymenobacter armeniacus]|uniref:Uncharacterized protein n=1 Tax=Hymenobacter armeniacus TaxID=2771358 RepID=A0ABR8JUX9_9BACT|nr:hypothetical protein [Hymenobacter armeniacus]MBD2722583.1 hypothetical protein [Hymenobacter armeniacus]
MAAQRALLPIYRLRFNLLYQFGFIEVSSDEWVPYERDSTTGHPDVPKANLLAKMPAFSTADEVVLLDIELPEQSKASLQIASAPSMGAHYPQLSSVAQAAFDTLAAELNKQPTASGNIRLNIAHVRRLYPLTTQAGQLLASRLDPRIKRQPAVFESVAEQADQRLLTSETRLGSEALLEIAGFPDERLDEELLQDVAKAVAIRLGRREIQSDDSFWVHLITYDRYEPFPKNDYGYLYDLCVVFYRSLSGRDGNRGHDNGFEATGFYRALEANKVASAREKVTQLLLQVEWAEKLRQSLTDPSNGLRKYLSAFLYLKLRQEFATEEYQFSRTLLEVIRRTADHYPSETRVALQLLGGFLTFDKISGAYYEVMQIPLFQDNGRKLTRVNNIDSKPDTAVKAPITFKVPNTTPAPRPAEIRPDEPAVTVELQVAPQKPKAPDLFAPQQLPWMTDEKPASSAVPVSPQNETSITHEAASYQATEPIASKSTAKGGRKAAAPKDGSKAAAPRAKAPAAGSLRGRKTSLADITQQVSREAEAPSIEFPAPDGSPSE